MVQYPLKESFKHVLQKRNKDIKPHRTWWDLNPQPHDFKACAKCQAVLQTLPAPRSRRNIGIGIKHALVSLENYRDGLNYGKQYQLY